MMSDDEAEFEVVSINNKKSSEKKESVIFVEQFVKNVCDFSSQYGSNISISYTAYNLAGSPSKFPDYGDFPQAFVMRTYGPWWNKAPSRLEDYMIQNNDSVISQDYIDVEYYQEVYPIRISIYETYNPGSVVGIWVQNPCGKWFQLWNGPPQFVPERPRIFSPPLKTCHFKTKMVRLEFNHDLLDYYTELDAVLLIGTFELIMPRNHMYHQNLSNLLQELGCNGYNNEDIYNLTPDYMKAKQDLSILKRMFCKYCILYNSKIMNNISKGKLVTTLGQHCHSVPPIEEAFNSLQEFLQEEFPKLIREMHLSSSSPICRISLQNDKNIFSTLNNIDSRPCGSFSALPDETVLKILKNLDLKTLCRLCRVNRHFSNIARDALLYTSLNLKPYWYCLNDHALKYLIPRCQYLQRLDLSWCGNYNMISDRNFVDFIHSCGMHDRLNVDEIAIELGNSCLKLESVDFWKAQTLTPHGVRALARCVNLREVDFGWCSGMGAPGDSLRGLLSSCRYLEKVFLAALRGLTDRDLEPLLLCQRLQQLDLLGARSLTPDMCYGFLLWCPKLEMIDLSFCEGIGDSKIQEWRRKYPHISFKRSFQVHVTDLL
ncbi:F-box/LRR-repeat protein 4 isoform X4 [Polistes fuscatus]|uniref:F-box/LRR-repeat protein 4 isoform X4 n=1 Tax=Polistes fuscatus TaxID=30207 RepID=UPI001CA8A3FC|nr:F-box/LRR-repeat protein 4 isoform X4 [Polistes fuscatus]